MAAEVREIDQRLLPSDSEGISVPNGAFGAVSGPGVRTSDFARGDHLFFQGDPHCGVFQIVTGTVTVYRLMSDGRRQIQAFAGPGDFLGLTLSADHDVSAQAVTDVEATFFPRAVFDRALRDDPDFRRAVFDLIGSMLMAARQQAVLLGRKCARERTASFLLEIAERCGAGASEYVEIPMSRCDIADYLGLTLETVSRMMSQFKQMGVIDLPRPHRFRLLDRARLVRLSGDDEADERPSIRHAVGF